jgi:peptidoglycan/LPS O-acetylase OafA/YrhL
LDVRVLFIISVAILLFTLYYLEQTFERDQIFWLYASLGLAFAVVSVFTVAREHPTYEYFLGFTTLFILIAILYYGTEEEEETAKRSLPPPPKAKKKPSRAKTRKGKKESGSAT